jgi:hypothetical protein
LQIQFLYLQIRNLQVELARNEDMARVTFTRRDFLRDRQGRTFADVLDDPEQPLDAVLEFLNDEGRQRRMEESEIHHDRPPLAGVVRELEAQPAIDEFLSTQHPHRTKRLRQAVGVVVRMVMERLGWSKTGKKGSLGVRAKIDRGAATVGAYHNTGGLAFWFLRGERYEHPERKTYPAVRDRARKLEAAPSKRSSVGKRGSTKARRPSAP